MEDEFQNLFEDNLFEDIALSSTEKLKEGERRVVSILFADISGFTKLSEKIDHEEVRDIIDKLFKVFTSSIEKYGGYVDKYAGDEIMALFGAKVASEVDTHRSISCALDMLDKLNKFNSYIINSPKFNIDKENKLSMRIGINTGMVTTGSIGKGREGDFTVYGEVVNLASRMESNAPLDRIMVPDNVVKQVGNKFIFKTQGKIKVKGFEEKIGVHLVESRHETDSQVERIPYIGNQNNLKVLTQMYDDLLSSLERKNVNDLRGIGIKGSAGIGKSRLVTEFINQASDGIETKNIIRVGADNISLSPYKIFIDIIKKSLSIGSSESSDEVIQKFNLGFNEIADMLDDKLKSQFIDVKARIAYLLGLRINEKVSEVSGEDLKSEIQLSIRTFIEAICYQVNLSNVPFIIIIEDIHWIDEASLDVLYNIIDIEGIGLNKKNVQNRALCFIFDYRDNYPLPEGIAQIGSFKEISIKPLGRDDCHEMIKHTMSEDIVPDEVVSTLLEHSSGNPFFIEEWLKSLGSEIKWSTDDISSWISSIPDSMHSLILSRVDTLDQGLKQLLQCAAVVGKEFYADMIERLEGKVDDLLDVSLGLELLVKSKFILPDKKRKNLYVFKHALTQEVTYDSMLKSNKKLLHGILADIIETNYQDKKEELVEQLATHYEKSDDTSKAKQYLLKAAEKSKRLCNLREAHDFYKRTINAYTQSDKALDYYMREDLKKLKESEIIIFLNILNDYAGILMSLGELEECEGVLSEAKNLLDSDINSKELYSKIYGNIGKMYFQTGSYDQAIESFKEQLTLSKNIIKEDEFCALFHLVGIAIKRGKFNNAEKQLNFMKENFPDNIYLSDIFSELGNLNRKNNNFDIALKFYSKAEKINTDLGQKKKLLNTLGNIGIVYTSIGEHQKALKIYNRILLINQEIGDKTLSNKTHGNKGHVLIRLKMYKEALQELELQLKTCEYSKDKTGIGKAKNNIGNVCMVRGEHDKALTCFNDALKISIDTGNRIEEGITLCSIGEVMMEMNKKKESKEYLEKSLQIFKDIGDSSLEKVILGYLEKVDDKT